MKIIFLGHKKKKNCGRNNGFEFEFEISPTVSRLRRVCNSVISAPQGFLTLEFLHRNEELKRMCVTNLNRKLLRPANSFSHRLSGSNRYFASKSLMQPSRWHTRK